MKPITESLRLCATEIEYARTHVGKLQAADRAAAAVRVAAKQIDDGIEKLAFWLHGKNEDPIMMWEDQAPEVQGRYREQARRFFE